jgi:hypothetical protein
MFLADYQRECTGMKRFLVLGCAFALALTACAGDRGDITEEFLPSTGGATTSTTASGGTSPPTTPTTLPVDPAEAVGQLVEEVRSIRQIEFTEPAVAYLPSDEVTAGYLALNGLARTGNNDFDTAFLQMLGVLDTESIDDLDNPCPVPGFYDPATGRLVLTEGLNELTPLGRRHLVAELNSAATDQVHDWSGAMDGRRRTGDEEGAVALWALVRGDAEFHADQFVEQVLTSTDRFAITLEQIACQQQRSTPPGYVTEMEAYNTEVGRALVEDLVSMGGIPAVDDAYRRRPTSSEQVYHPARYTAREPALDVELRVLSLAGFAEADTGTFGERQFRALLSEGVSSAQALQAATGWGGDTYRALWNGSDIVLVVAFEGDEARDARELAETLGGWASASLGVGAGRPDHTGLAFEGEDYAFAAHQDNRMLLVISSSAEAGRDIRNIFWPEW